MVSRGDHIPIWVGLPSHEFQHTIVRQEHPILFEPIILILQVPLFVVREAWGWRASRRLEHHFAWFFRLAAQLLLRGSAAKTSRSVALCVRNWSGRAQKLSVIGRLFGTVIRCGGHWSRVGGKNVRCDFPPSHARTVYGFVVLRWIQNPKHLIPVTPRFPAIFQFITSKSLIVKKSCMVVLCTSSTAHIVRETWSFWSFPRLC